MPKTQENENQAVLALIFRYTFAVQSNNGKKEGKRPSVKIILSPSMIHK